MKVCILYHPYSEHARPVEEFARDFERRHGNHVELMSLETREGSAAASLYDVVQYPAVLVLREDGQLLQHWVGDRLPLMNEVAAVAR